MTAPLVSVVIPAYNAASTLGECLASVFAQGYPALEIIVVDDGSQDETASVVAGYGDRVRYLHQPNGGLSAARNAGHMAAKGELVAWLDADDMCLPDRIALQAEYLSSHPTVGLVSSEFSAFDKAGLRAERHGSTYYGVRAKSQLEELYGPREALVPRNRDWLHGAHGEIASYRGRVYSSMAWGNFVHPPTVMLRRSVVDAAGPHDPAMRLAEDWEFLIRASRATEFGYLDVPLLSYRLHAAQMSAGSAYDHLMRWIAVREKTFAADPVLSATGQDRSRGQLGSWHSWLARHAAETDRLLALKHLMTAAWYGLESRAAFAALSVALLPRGVFHVLRAARHIFRF
jgi:glycosyltransferase involved in cell wall biosynthesis